MSTYNETGHSKNVSNFEDLISFCSAYGTNYKPTKPIIQIDALQQLHVTTANAINALVAKQATYKNAINARAIAFEPLRKLSTRIANAFEACGATDQSIDDVKYFVRKMRGDGNKKKPKEEITSTNPEVTSPETSTHSTSQLSFDSKVEHLSGLIALLSAEPLYQPNEVDLSIAGLLSLLADLKAKNTAVINAYTKYSNALIERNKLLYSSDNGLVDAAFDVKKYVKSIFGASSAEFRQVSGIRFSRTQE